MYHKLIKPGSFVRNITTLLTGNVIAQAIAFLSAPIITRLYTPDDFGAVAYISSLIAILSVISCMRYEQAIVLPRDEKKAQNIFELCVICVFIFSCLLSLVIIFGGDYFASVMDKSWLRAWLWFVPVGFCVQGLYNSYTFRCTRKKQFTLLSTARVATSIVAVTIKVIVGLLLGSTILWLICGNIVGLIAAVVVLGWGFSVKSFKIQSSIKDLVDVAREYSKFPKYAVPTGLLNSLSQNLPVLLLAYYFPREIVGYYGLANTMLRRPISLVSESVSKVYLQKVSELQSQNICLRDSMVKTTCSLAAIYILPFALLSLCGSWFFTAVFGESWAEAGLYVQLLAPWLFFLSINPPATQVIVVQQRLRFNLIYNIVTLVVRIVSIVVAFQLYPKPWVAVGAFSASGVMVNVFYIYYGFSLTR